MGQEPAKRKNQLWLGLMDMCFVFYLHSDLTDGYVFCFYLHGDFTDGYAIRSFDVTI